MNNPRTYRILFNPDSWKDLMKLPEQLQDSLLNKIYTLEQDPRPSGCKKLKGRTGFYRVRLSDYRIIYDVQDSVLVVVVVEVGDRKDIYD